MTRDGRAVAPRQGSTESSGAESMDTIRRTYANANISSNTDDNVHVPRSGETTPVKPKYQYVHHSSFLFALVCPAHVSRFWDHSS